MGFTQGGLGESHRNRRVGAIIYSFSLPPPPPRLSQPGEEQCRHLCQSDGENFLVSRGAQFVDGTRCEWASPPPFGSTAACLRGTCQVESNHERQLTDFMPRLLIAAARPSSAVWLRRLAAFWESKRCVWSVWGKWIVLQFDVRILHCGSSQRYRNILYNRSYLLPQNILKLPCITSQTLV